MLRIIKAIQASAVLLKEHAGTMSRMRLLKMLYMADRKSMVAIGRTVTGDHPFAMANGPVLTQVYDLIKGCDPYVPTWERFIQRHGPQDVILCNDPGVDELSRWEIETLVSIAKECANMDDYEVADLTHEFPEWMKNRPAKGQSKIIPWDDVLEALNLREFKDVLAAEATARERAEQILAQ